jgi:hypothetical protein
MNEVITYIPEQPWLLREVIRPAAYGALAGIIINSLLKLF